MNRLFKDMQSMQPEGGGGAGTYLGSRSPGSDLHGDGKREIYTGNKAATRRLIRRKSGITSL